MASNDETSEDAAPKRRNLRYILLTVLVILALGDGALLLYFHYHKNARQNAPQAASLPASLPATQPLAAAKPLPQAPAPAVSQPLPTFDIVRVDPQGNAVLAGRAVPGAKVTVKDGDAVLGTVVADSQGEFVLLPSTPLLPGAHEITLSETLPDGKVVQGAQSASVDLPGGGQSALAVVSGPGGSQVMTGQGPKPGQLGMGAVDYDTHGKAIFSGTAPAGATVKVTLGGKELGVAQSDSSGHWRLKAPIPATPGIITLNATTRDGMALAPVSVPFAPEKLSTALSDGHVLIEPGDNLWMIARKVYGQGVMYTLIYAANAGEIHNPNLIFPGQDFVLPKK